MCLIYEKEMATAAKQRFYDPEGDYAGLLKMFSMSQLGTILNV